MVLKWCRRGSTESGTISGSYPIDGTEFLLRATPDHQAYRSRKTYALCGEGTTHRRWHNKGEVYSGGNGHVNFVLIAGLVIQLYKSTH